LSEQWNAAYRALTDIGIDLQYGRSIPGNWKIMGQDSVGPYEIIFAVPPEYFSGYERGKGQQTLKFKCELKKEKSAQIEY
jgi:hypothetical protein